MIRRQREKFTYFPAGTQVQRAYSSTGVLQATYNDAFPAQERTNDFMDDDPSPYRGNKVMAHKSSETVFRKPLSGWTASAGNYNVIENGYFGHPTAMTVYGSLPFPSLSASHSWAGLPFDPTPAVVAASNEFQPIAEEFSVVNSVLELGDLRSLVSDIAHLKSRARALAPALAASRNSVRRSSDGTVNLFLQYNFGIAPLIADMKALQTAYYKILDRLKFLKSTWGRPVTMRHRHVFPIADDPNPTWNWADTGFQGAIQRRDLVYKVVISMKLFHKLENLGDLYSWIRLANLYSGTNKPLKILWNAVPFSFVVDWVYNVSDILDQFRLPVFTGRYELYDPWWSLKGSCRLTYHFLPYAHKGNPVQTYWEGKASRYLRVHGVVPVSYFSLPTWYQSILGGALVWSNRPRR